MEQQPAKTYTSDFSAAFRYAAFGISIYVARFSDYWVILKNTPNKLGGAIFNVVVLLISFAFCYGIMAASVATITAIYHDFAQKHNKAIRIAVPLLVYLVIAVAWGR